MAGEVTRADALGGMTAIVLAGGLGTRLGAAAGGRPKALADVGGRPFLDILLDGVVRAGVGDIVVAVGHLRDAIMDHLGSSYGGAPVTYSVEESPLGTGGAVRQALGLVDTPDALVMNGDTYCGVDVGSMVAAHRDQEAPLSMATCQVSDVSRYGAVTIEGGRAVGFSEKGRSGPGWINAGTYVVNRSLLSRLQAESPPFSFEDNVLRALAAGGGVPVFTADGPFLDIGTPEDLGLASTVLA